MPIEQSRDYDVIKKVTERDLSLASLEINDVIIEERSALFSSGKNKQEEMNN